MRIAVITPFYRPSIGGVEYIAYHTARELVRRGYEVHIITTTHDNRWKRISDPGTWIEEGVVIHRLEPSVLRIGYATLMKGLKTVIKRISPDIVHCHNLHPHLFQAIEWKREVGYRIVAQLHHPTATGIDHLPARLLYRYVMRILVKKQREVDAFIAHTNMEKKWLIDEGIEEKRIHIVRYPCIPDELLNYRPETDIHDRLGVDKVIACIGRIHPRKGQHLLVEALKHIRQDLKDVKAYVAGPIADEKYLKQILKTIEKHDLKHHVVIDPRPLPEHDKYDVMASSDLFTHISLKDYTPTIILEALALGTPVIASKIGAIHEMIQDREVGLLIEPGSVNELVKALEILLTNDKLRKIMSLKAREWAKRFTVGRVVDELEEIYDNI